MNRRTAGLFAAILTAALLSLLLLPLTSASGYAAEADDGTAREETEAAVIVAGGGAAVTNQVEGVGYATQLYDSTNGLPTSDANAILATSDGFIWIGGYSGLIRYDGTSFVRMDASGGITNANALLEDSQGRLWVGTNDNGIVVTSQGFSKHFDYTYGLPSSKIQTLSEDGSGNIIVGSSQGVCYIDSSLEFHNLDDPLLNNAYIIRVVADREGTVYGCTRSGIIFCIKDARVTACYNSEDMGAGTVTAIYPDPDEIGSVYFATDDGLVCRGSVSDNFAGIEKIPLSRTNDDHNDTDNSGRIVSGNINWISYASGRIWAITDEAVCWLDENRKFHAIENIPLTSSIGSMIEDYEGNLWFTSARQGIMKIVANKFTDITEHAALEPQVVNSTCMHKGMLYIATDSGLQIVNGNNKEVTNELTEFLRETRIRCLMEDRNNNLWISTYTNGMGLVCYTPDDRIVSYTEDNGLLHNRTRCTALGSDGSVLAGTNGGLVVIRDGVITRKIGSDSGLNNTVILTVAEGDNGKYYLGTDGDGIYVVDGNMLSRLGREDGLSSDVVMRIKKDEKRGVFWIITSNSIAYMKDDIVTTVDSFPYNNNYDVYFDDTDNIWVLASNGIYVVKAKDMIEKDSFEYLFYDTTSGLPCVPTGNSFSYLSEDGTLYLSGRSGASSVNINRYFEKTHEIKLSIPYIEADGKRYYTDEKNRVTIPSSSKVVTIYGYALTYSMHNPTIQYYLEGFDRNRTVVSKQKMEPVRYTNLHGGEYKYKLSIVNTSTSEIQQTTSLTIVKEKAFYERAWFYLLLAALFAALMYEVVRRVIQHKTNTLLKKQEENRTYIREMTEAFAKTIDMKDKYTNGHSFRVAEYTQMLAEELGCDAETVAKYRQIALLHDIGKIGVPSEVLNKPGMLSEEEFGIIKSHSSLGYNVLKDISIMPELAIGAGAHHERPDGKGYPNHLKEEDIPRVAQIIAVADAFDAMYSDRPYRKRMNFNRAVSIIKDAAGTQLVSDVVDAFLRIVEKGGFIDPDDDGGGTMDDINNIHNSNRKEKNDNGGKSGSGGAGGE